jgi:hypothetical protein
MYWSLPSTTSFSSLNCSTSDYVRTRFWLSLATTRTLNEQPGSTASAESKPRTSQVEVSLPMKLLLYIFDCHLHHSNQFLGFVFFHLLIFLDLIGFYFLFLAQRLTNPRSKAQIVLLIYSNFPKLETELLPQF